MQKHVVKFDRPLTHVALVPPVDRSPVNAEKLPATPSHPQKQVQTDQPQPVKSFDPQPDLSALLEEIHLSIEDLKRNQDESRHQLQELSIRLAVRIARAVVLYEVSHHDLRIRALLESFMKRNEPQHPVVVRINKTDMDRLLISLPDTPSLDSAIQLKQDDSMMPGDCLVESTHQCVVASFERQLDEIQEQLMETLENARTERTHSEPADLRD